MTQAKDGLIEEAVSEAAQGAATVVTAATDTGTAVAFGTAFDTSEPHDAATQYLHSMEQTNDMDHRLSDGLLAEANRIVSAGQGSLHDQGSGLIVVDGPPVSASATE